MRKPQKETLVLELQYLEFEVSFFPVPQFLSTIGANKEFFMLFVVLQEIYNWPQSDIRAELEHKNTV